MYPMRVLIGTVKTDCWRIGACRNRQKQRQRDNTLKEEDRRKRVNTATANCKKCVRLNTALNRTQNTKLKTNTQTDHKTQNTKHKTQNTKHKTQNTKHKTQNTKHKLKPTIKRWRKGSKMSTILTPVILEMRSSSR